MMGMMPALLSLVLLATATSPPPPPPPPQLHCDVLIAGGSTAALAAALTAAVVAPGRDVCLTEPTDELGGQLAFNPAIDYGMAPRTPSTEWRSLEAHVTPAHSPCWVSKSYVAHEGVVAMCVCVRARACVCVCACVCGSEPGAL